MIQTDIFLLLKADGQVFQAAEQSLKQAGQPALAAVQEAEKTAAGFERLVLQVTAAQMKGYDLYQEVLDFLAKVEKEKAETAKGYPSPLWVAGMLRSEYGAQAAPLLGVYLNKLQRVWPQWKTMAVIAYLGLLAPNPAASEALIQFVLSSPIELYQKPAAESLVAVGDADTIKKLEDQAARLASRQSLLEQAAQKIREKPRA